MSGKCSTQVQDPTIYSLCTGFTGVLTVTVMNLTVTIAELFSRTKGASHSDVNQSCISKDTP